MIDIEHQDIDVFQYKLMNIDIIENLKVFVNNSDKKYVLIVSDEVLLNPNSFKELDLSSTNSDIVELKSLDKDTGIVNYAGNLTGAQRLMKIFPTIQEQDEHEVTPRIPRIVLYKRELLNTLLTHIPINARRLNYALDYLLEVLINCDFKVNRSVEVFNDKIYGEYSKITCKKVFVSESLLYIDRILVNLGIKSDYYKSFVYWSKEEIKHAL